jgi:methionine sulfoxide reductase catalytic subunit
MNRYIHTQSNALRAQITDKVVFDSRRAFIKSTAMLSAGLLLPNLGLAQTEPTPALAITARAHATNYTNYYEFSTNKEDSTQLAKALKTTPWSVEVSGEIEKPGLYHLEDILKANAIQERIYRFRCVEAWSMVVPWLGFPLGEMLARFKPTSRAKFVEFTTLYNPEVMIGQRSAILDWPYVEGLRMDEAMHPLTILATGMYGEDLPNQNGAPLRLVVPWKYGFKSIKAIVKIHFRETMPDTAWHKSAPREYGFYANVNPEVSHPRWSQSRERVLGSSIFSPKRATELFNGYGAEVASLYTGMDLTQSI